MSNVDWSEAPDWADKVVKFSGEIGSYWAGSGNCQKIGGAIVYVMNNDGYEILSIRPDKWQEGEERMNNIAQNGNDGHYSETPKPDVIEHGNNNKYSRKIKTIVVDGIDHDIYVDVYDVLTAFKTTNPANDHAIKKQLATGQRGVKGVIQDLTEARDSLNRAIELEKSK